MAASISPLVFISAWYRASNSRVLVNHLSAGTVPSVFPQLVSTGFRHQCGPHRVRGLHIQATAFGGRVLFSCLANWQAALRVPPRKDCEFSCSIRHDVPYFAPHRGIRGEDQNLMSARNAGIFIIARLTPPCAAKCHMPSDCWE